MFLLHVTILNLANTGRTPANIYSRKQLDIGDHVQLSHPLRTADTQSTLSQLNKETGIFLQTTYFRGGKMQKAEDVLSPQKRKKKKKEREHKHRYSSEGIFIAVLTRFETTTTCLIS